MSRKRLYGAAFFFVLVVVASVFLITTDRKTDKPRLPGKGYAEHKKYYDIIAAYATSTPLSGEAGAAAKKLMHAFVRETVAEFKQQGNFDDLTEEDIVMMGYDDGRKQTLHITYSAERGPHTISYIYSIYQDTLGAHGNMFFRTFTFDLASGASLTLADVFEPESSYLEMLSAESRARLPGILGDMSVSAFIREGTRPLPANFRNFYFSGSDFVLLFEPYQVAPYAAGPQMLSIPLKNLSPVLKPQYR